ncbi:cyclic nucleotide-binding domain-containing protein [Clostridium sp. D2Q-11]|uniref:Cyclic nucleotide-binding domain-containing protein n=1 Tax=Anaeromonas frigoriresistens TaxID=2683708 RepID=A0A942Z986_9FIRM|nr:cyclic nucleotide-binding domain-containing protein [Anaeromonas frigoriresistens]MBS4538854.1 cyclic nucleotide-binding domain-containing protein [Anaeromonas frigoriresistens]
MKQITDLNKLEYYIEKYNIQDIFEKDMTPSMELILFDKNEHICREQERLDYFYFLVEGKAKVYKLLENGRSLLLTFYNPLVVIGDVEFIDIDVATSNVQALEKTICLGIPMNELRKEITSDTKFLKYVCKVLGYKLDRISKVSSINLLYSVENRLASYLLAIAPNDSANTNIDEFFTCKLTEMAELLGVSYRHLLRTINTLCEKRIIKRNKGSITILNRDLLKELAGDIYD